MGPLVEIEILTVEMGQVHQHILTQTEVVERQCRQEVMCPLNMYPIPVSEMAGVSGDLIMTIHPINLSGIMQPKEGQLQVNTNRKPRLTPTIQVIDLVSEPGIYLLHNRHLRKHTETEGRIRFTNQILSRDLW